MPRLSLVIGNRPPYAIATATFRFRALASHAGRASLGGDREMALACFAVARLASGMLPPFTLAPADTDVRIAGMRQWLSSLTLQPSGRSALSNVIDAVSGGDHAKAATAVKALVPAAAGQIDAPSATELTALATELADRNQ